MTEKAADTDTYIIIFSSAPYGIYNAKSCIVLHQNIDNIAAKQYCQQLPILS